MLDFSLHLWNDRCDTMHGIDEEDAKRILKHNISAKVAELFGRREAIEAEYGYLFKEPIGSLQQRTTQYLMKWVASFRAAENVLAREKMKGRVGAIATVRRGGRGKGKNSPSRDNTTRRTDQGAGSEVQKSPVRAYSARHQQLINAHSGRQVVRPTVINESHTGDTGDHRTILVAYIVHRLQLRIYFLHGK